MKDSQYSDSSAWHPAREGLRIPYSLENLTLLDIAAGGGCENASLLFKGDSPDELVVSTGRGMTIQRFCKIIVVPGRLLAVQLYQCFSACFIGRSAWIQIQTVH